jgi:hypothetical protein
MNSKRVRECIEEAVRQTRCSQVALHDLFGGRSGRWIVYFEIEDLVGSTRKKALPISIRFGSTADQLTAEVLRRLEGSFLCGLRARCEQVRGTALKHTSSKSGGEVRSPRIGPLERAGLYVCSRRRSRALPRGMRYFPYREVAADL